MPNSNNAAPPDPEVVWLDDTGSERGAPLHARVQVLSIANVAKMFGVSQLVLLYYELRGLIGRRQRQGRTRVYGWADCERLSFIIKCRKARLPLRDIGAIIDATEEDAPVSVSKHGQELCMALVDRLEGQRKELDEALAEFSHLYALLTSKVVARDLVGRD